MSHSIELLLLFVGALLAASVVASQLSSRLRVPAILFFILLGMLLGSVGVSGVYFDDVHLARVIGTVALAFILFAGGLDFNWANLPSVFWPGISLATIAVFVTAALVAIFTHFFFGLSLETAFLLGAVVSSTDAAAVFGVLRAAGIRLKRLLVPLLEFESGSNDPSAVFLTLAVTQIIVSGDHSLHSAWLLLPSFLLQMLVGAGFGAAVGEAGARFLQRARLEYDGLYPAVTVALASIAYGGGTVLGGSGFLAAYVAGLVLGRHNFLHRIALIQFHDGLAWLFQIVVFMTLGLLVFPSRLLSVAGEGLLLALFLGFVARPAAVFAALSLMRRFLWREKLLVSWAGLRGAVPVILATIPLTEGVPQAEYIFDLVFFVVLASVLLHGTTLSPVASVLGLARKPHEAVIERRVASNLWEVMLPPDSPAAGKRVVDLKMPSSALIVLLVRGSENYIPRGATMLEAGDRLLVATRKGDIEDLKSLFLAGEGGKPHEIVLPEVG